MLGGCIRRLLRSGTLHHGLSALRISPGCDCRDQDTERIDQTVHRPSTSRRRAWRGAGLALALVRIGLLAAACGGASASPVDTRRGERRFEHVEDRTDRQHPYRWRRRRRRQHLDRGRRRGTATSDVRHGRGQPPVLRVHAQPRRTELPRPEQRGPDHRQRHRPELFAVPAAQQACAKYNPKGGKAPSPAQQQAVAQALKFSECMRSHGITDFPDPQVSSSAGGVRIGIKIQNGQSSNLNPNNPRFQAEQKACQGEMPSLPPVSKS